MGWMWGAMGLGALSLDVITAEDTKVSGKRKGATHAADDNERVDVSRWDR